jgi:hypothetical protein
VVLEREHEHDCSARVFFFTYPSLFLSPVWAKAQAESPRIIRVCFILISIDLIIHDLLEAFICFIVTKISNSVE